MTEGGRLGTAVVGCGVLHTEENTKKHCNQVVSKDVNSFYFGLPYNTGNN